MKIKAVIERGEDGTYGVYMDDDTLNYSVNGDGNTVDDAKKDFLAAYEAMKIHFVKTGKEFVESEFYYQYDMASFLQYYSKILSLAGLERLTGVNQGQLSHYITGHRKPSRKTTEKIELALHRFAKEISQVEFA